MKTINGRELITFQKLHHGFRSKVEKIGVHKLRPSQVQKRDILILGTGRCGTTTMAKILQRLDLDVRHEKVGKHGTSSLFFNVDSDWYPYQPWCVDKVHYGERRSDFEFKHVLHVVRHPLKTISSMGGIFPSMNYEFFESNGIIPIGIRSQMLRNMHAWFNLNKLAEKQSEYRFQIEKLVKSWRQIMVQLEFDCDTPMPELIVANKATGFRKREPVTWQDLTELDQRLGTRIRLMAAQYGYQDAKE